MVQRTSIFVEIHRDDPNLGAAHRNIIAIRKHPQNIAVRRTFINQWNFWFYKY